MSIERIITKQKAAIEDFTVGINTEVQTRNGVAYTLSQVNASLLPIVEATGVELADISDAINTTAKVQRKQVWDTTADKPLWAAGTLAADVWKDATGATVRTPV